MGCRQRAPAKELLRIVAEVHEGDGVAESGTVILVPDPARRRPGRGAHLHPDPACLALAERRRVFGRALRVTGVLDAGRLAGWLAVTDGGALAPPDPAR